MRDFDVNYIVNEEAGVVVCVISNCEANVIAMIAEQTDLFNVPFGFVLEDFDFFMNNQYKGVAKCAKGDTFNKEYGKKLAYRKAYAKYARGLNRRINYILKDYKKRVYKNIDIIENISNKTADRSINATNSYLKVLEEAK